jgi:hypothetical protein
MHDGGLGKFIEANGKQGLIKEYPLNDDILQTYDLTPSKYHNALETKQHIKSQVLTETQVNFFDNNGGKRMKRKLFQGQDSSEDGVDKEEGQCDNLATTSHHPVTYLNTRSKKPKRNKNK